jgi:hypothetical protein
MIGEEELYRSCKEGVCIGDLARKTNANYGARCDVIKFENRLVLKFELYSVSEDAIFETFTDYNVKNFDGMIASLEKRLPGVFKKMMNASKSREITGGIGSVEYGGGRVHRVILSTIPQGAGLSFNGAPIDGCAKSPCNVELPEGKVRILAALAQYETADTTVTVNSNNQYININLKPNVGVLTIKPAYSGNIGANIGWGLSINGKWASKYENTLSPGNCSVKLNHDCYEEISFKAGIVKGRNETFDLAQHLKLKTGVLVLYAQRDGLPVSEPVFVNGSHAGQTPFNGYVPVCSEITIGDSGNRVNVAIAHNKTVQHRYVFPATPAPTVAAAPPIENTPSHNAPAQQTQRQSTDIWKAYGVSPYAPAQQTKHTDYVADILERQQSLNAPAQQATQDFDSLAARRAPSLYAAQQTKARKTSPAVIALRVTGAATAGIGLLGVLVVDGEVKNSLDRYKAAQTDTPQVVEIREDIDYQIARRNTMYTVVGVGLAVFTVTLFF